MLNSQTKLSECGIRMGIRCEDSEHEQSRWVMATLLCPDLEGLGCQL